MDLRSFQKRASFSQPKKLRNCMSEDEPIVLDSIGSSYTAIDEDSASIAEESGVIYEEPIPQDDQAYVLRNDPRRESFIRLIALVTACFLET